MPSVIESVTATTTVFPTTLPPEFYVNGLWLLLFLIAVLIGLVLTK